MLKKQSEERYGRFRKAAQVGELGQAGEEDQRVGEPFEGAIGSDREAA